MKKIENLFVDYIIDSIGPNKQREEQRQKIFLDIKSIILQSLEVENKSYLINIIPFGSFPSKMYISDSDIDISILIRNKDHSLYDYNYEFLSNTLLKITNHLERTESVTNVSLIHADVKIIKCQIENIPIDISICNYVGLCKLYLLTNLETTVFKNTLNINLFKRTLLLIKIWSQNESSILGSNIGLMASYCLECLVMYLFNEKFNTIESEFHGFCLFFELISQINWEKEIITIYGKLTIEEYLILSNKNDEEYEKSLTSLFKKENTHLSNENILSLQSKVSKFKDSDRTQSFNSNKKIIGIKYMNVLDPLFPSNNLGKSINFYNYTKIKKSFEIMNKKLTKMNHIFSASQGRYSTPINYLNSLFKLFKNTMTNVNHELFFLSLNRPKILINEGANDYFVDDVPTFLSSSNNQVASLDVKSIEMFNDNFKEVSKKTDNSINSYITGYNSLYITKDIVIEFLNCVDYNESFITLKDLSTQLDDKTIIDIINS